MDKGGREGRFRAFQGRLGAGTGNRLPPPSPERNRHRGKREGREKGGRAGAEVKLLKPTQPPENPTLAIRGSFA